jgi:uncharacterized protein YjbJ (UPF0337 family)
MFSSRLRRQCRQDHRIQIGSHTMAAENKAANKVTELKGKAKKHAGQQLGDQQMEAEGQADQAKGNLKQAGEKVKDAFRK